MKKKFLPFLAVFFALSLTLSACITITLGGKDQKQTSEETEEKKSSEEKDSSEEIGKETESSEEKDSSDNKETNSSEENNSSEEDKSSEEKKSESADTETEPTPAVDPAPYYILPESNERILTEKDLEDLDVETLRLARNEIYARHGRMFKSKDLQDYFDQQVWYEGTVSADAFSNEVLSQIELKNAAFIEDYENRQKYTYDLKSFTFTLPAFYRDKDVKVVTGTDSVELKYKDYTFVSIIVDNDTEAFMGDIQSGGNELGVASNGNHVGMCYDSIPIYIRGTDTTGSWFEGASSQDMEYILYLQSGELWLSSSVLHLNVNDASTLCMTATNFTHENISSAVKLK